ncbi:metallophosphoesterase [Halocatena pleomorpha]|uniref:Phosphoesterase n=2 Tax=Halocatena pleomorpha TaxID=1785090 RepID=A0A3P3RKD1_9EURY|nr:metallophosphoesterase [Halocatena pleomorpha]RRJ33835.1 metallophosphoesterase [Halocatena pleomorpha]
MITVVSDTHGQSTHRLSDQSLTAVRTADLVVHAGDFITESVLTAFESESTRFVGVAGNSDTFPIQKRLPATRTVEHDGIRIAIAHGHNHTKTSRSLFARQQHADLLVVGHSHTPMVRSTDEYTLLNPGSHAEPRGNRPAYATLEATDDGCVGRLCELDGTVFKTFTVST